jgi:hypothetical protein
MLRSAPNAIDQNPEYFCLEADPITPLELNGAEVDLMIDNAATPPADYDAVYPTIWQSLPPIFLCDKYDDQHDMVDHQWWNLGDCLSLDSMPTSWNDNHVDTSTFPVVSSFADDYSDFARFNSSHTKRRFANVSIDKAYSADEEGSKL